MQGAQKGVHHSFYPLNLFLITRLDILVDRISLS